MFIEIIFTENTYEHGTKKTITSAVIPKGTRVIELQYRNTKTPIWNL